MSLTELVGQAKEVVVTLKGMRALVQSYASKNGLEIVELDPEKALFTQLMSIPPELELTVILPERMSKTKSEGLRDRIFRTNAARKLFINTHQRFATLWALNALENVERLKTARLLHELQKKPGKTKALLVGNGPSVEALRHVDTETCAIFACWHVAWKLVQRGLIPDYVLHIDPNVPDSNFEMAPLTQLTELIAAPTVTPDFLKAYPELTVYNFIYAGLPIHSWFAQQAGISEHPAIEGTVMHGALLAAILSQYNEVGVIGLDLSTPALPEKTLADPGVICNGEGQLLSVNAQFMSYKEAIERLASLNPSIKFYNYGLGGQDLHGFPRKKL
jgi:hypothetical protein